MFLRGALAAHSLATALDHLPRNWEGGSARRSLSRASKRQQSREGTLHQLGEEGIVVVELHSLHQELGER
jgi:hypothetical protein